MIWNLATGAATRATGDKELAKRQIAHSCSRFDRAVPSDPRGLLDFSSRRREARPKDQEGDFRVNQRHINSYLSDIDRLRKFGGKSNEQVIRGAFQDLLKQWSKDSGLVFVPELLYETPRKTKVYPDGTILHDVRVPLGGSVAQIG